MSTSLIVYFTDTLYICKYTPNKILEERHHLLSILNLFIFFLWLKQGPLRHEHGPRDN